MNSNRTVKALSILGAAAVALLVIFCGVQLRKLDTRYSVRQFFPKDHPALAADDEMEKTFQLRSEPSFFVTMELRKDEPGTWLEPKRMAQLKADTDQIAAWTGVKNTVSLATVQMALNEGNELRIGSIAESLPPERWTPYVTTQALLRPQLITKDGRGILIVIEPVDTASETLKSVETNLNGLFERGGDLQRPWGVAGVPAVQSRLSEKLQDEVGRFLVLCLIVFVLMFVVFYRNYSPVVFAAIGLVACNITAMGFLAAFGVPFSVLLSTLPIIVSIAFVSLAIHNLHLWSDQLAEHGSPTELATRFRLSWATLKEMALANLLGSATTAIGFAMLATTAIPAIRQYAIVIAASVMWSYVLTQILLVIAQPWFTPELRGWTRQKAWWMVALTKWSVPIFAATIVCCVVLAAAGYKLNFSARLFDDLPESEPVRAAATTIDQRFGGTVNLDIGIDAHTDEAWKDPAALRELRSSLDQLRGIEGVGSALGLTDFMGEKTPATRGEVAEVFFLFSMAPENPLRQFVDNDSRRARVTLRLEDLPSNRVDAIRADARRILENHFPNARILESGLAVNSHTINREVARELVFGFWQSLVVIGLMLVVLFRSARWALLACLPNLVPPAVLIGALAFNQTPVKPSIALIFSIALGLAFNNTVYMLSRLHRMRGQKKMFHLPLRRTLLEEGMPCLSESMLTFAGFLIFLSSDFKLNQTFGAYMVLSIAAGAWGDLVFLPVLMKLFPEILTGSRPKATQLTLVVSNEEAPVTVPAVTEKPAKLPWAAAIVGLLAAASFAATPARADEASDLLKKARTAIESQSDQGTVTLKIIEANGDVKTRTLKLKTMREGDTFHALARIQAPADIKGTALLAEIKDGEENQWLYLPSSKQVRRVVSGGKSAGVLGSELNPDDLNSTAIRGSSVKLLKKDAASATLEVKPKSGASEYSSVVVTLSLPDALPLKTQYFTGTQEKKTVEFQDYAVFGKVHRAKKIVVKNLVNKRGTEVEFSDLKINSGVSAGDFNVSALKRD